MPIRDLYDPGSGTEKFRSRIRYKHPGSATLLAQGILIIANKLVFSSFFTWQVSMAGACRQVTRRSREGAFFLRLKLTTWGGASIIFLANRHRYGTKDGRQKKNQKNCVPVLRIRIWLQALKWFGSRSRSRPGVDAGDKIFKKNQFNENVKIL